MTSEATAATAAPSLRSGILGYLPRPLLEPRQPVVAALLGWLTAFGPSILLAALVSVILPDVAQPEFDVSGAMAIFLIVILSPIAETLIMGGVLLVLLRLMTPTAAVLFSAIGWGALHSLMAPAWGLVIWWPFLVFSTLFVTWRERSLAAAFTMPAVVHMLQNLPSALLLASGVEI